MADRHINELIDEYINYVESDKNQRNKKYWSLEDQISKDLFSRLAPKNLNDIDRIPVTVGPLNSLFANIFSFSLNELYNDPKVWLKNYLKNYLYRMKHIPEDMYFDKELPLYLGPHLPWTLYGVKGLYFNDREPELDKKEPLIGKKGNLDKMEIPDFYESGMMPLVHKMYNDVNEILNGKLKLVFPGYNRGPFGIAVILRGLQNLLIDMRTDPEFVHKLMKYITDSRKEWEKERSLFLNESQKMVDLWNDEVAIPTLSPKYYKEFVLPYEKEIDETTGIGYWHSCGDTTLIAKDIASIKHIIMYHISSWTDLEKAMKDADSKKIEFGLNPEKYVQNADKDTIKEKMKEVIGICKKVRPKAFYILLNGLDVIGRWEDNLEKLRYWYKCTNEIGRL
jgi:uroporphyrinogen-III decarboxylase